jgi:phospholipase/lecithinase/hemolysin
MGVCNENVFCHFLWVKTKITSQFPFVDILPLLTTVWASCLLFVSSPLRGQEIHPYTGMVVFGDSLSDVGNLNSVLSSVSEKTAQYLTGWDPNYYYNYRFSNGPVWADYLYTALGFGNIGEMVANDGVNNMAGTNFAWAGSRSGTGTYGFIFPNLLTQVDNYSDQIADGNPYLPVPATTLYAIWSGANDVFAYLESGDSITPEQVADNISTAISTLYGEGGRYFLVLNLPPIGQIPSYVNDPLKADMGNAFVSIYNDLLESELDALASTLEDITIFRLDVHDLYLEIMADYHEYGFTNVTETAYVRFGEIPYEPREPPYGKLMPDSEGFFFWDSAHGTTALNALIMQAAYPIVAVPEPAVVALLFGGTVMLALVMRRRRMS